LGGGVPWVIDMTIEALEKLTFNQQRKKKTKKKPFVVLQNLT